MNNRIRNPHTSTPVAKRLSPLLIGVGLLLVVPIVIMALLVDLQPAGSALAMIISMFGSIMGVLVILGVIVGGLGVLLHSFGKN